MGERVIPWDKSPEQVEREEREAEDRKLRRASKPKRLQSHGRRASQLTLETATKLYSAPTIAAHIGDVSVDVVREAFQSGEIPTYWVGKRRKATIDSVERWLLSRPVHGTQVLAFSRSRSKR